jgi:hypothetical protein
MILARPLSCYSLSSFAALLLPLLVTLVWPAHLPITRSHILNQAFLQELESNDCATGRQLPLLEPLKGEIPWTGIAFEAKQSLCLQLPRSMRPLKIELIADAEDSYQLMGLNEQGQWHALWTALPLDRGYSRRSSPVLPGSPTLRALRVRGQGGDAAFHLLQLRVQELRYALPTWGVAVGALLLLLLSASASVSFKDWLRSKQVLLAASISAVLLMPLDSSALEFLLLLGILCPAALLLQRLGQKSLRFVALWLLLLACCAAAATLLLRQVLLTRLRASYETTLDHRPRPDAKEINQDSLRFRGTDSDISEQQFSILFLGDSFTFGEHVSYDQAFPYQVEQLLQERQCAQEIKVVNAGWVSASPLLALRALPAFARRYKPDLVIYNLDMTDFHDDLRYQRSLAVGAEHAWSWAQTWRVFVTFAGRSLLGVDPLLEAQRVLRPNLNPKQELDELPAERYFANLLPLSESEPQLRRGVLANLERLQQYAAEQLSARFALTILPRAFQYSARESPQNWEVSKYEVLGPYSRAPFEFFSRERLPYPQHELLTDFASSQEFPLYLANDPHWNAQGHALAARSISGWLLREKLVPCE